MTFAFFHGVQLWSLNIRKKAYSHRQNYRKKKDGKMLGYYPGNP